MVLQMFCIYKSCNDSACFVLFKIVSIPQECEFTIDEEGIFQSEDCSLVSRHNGNNVMGLCQCQGCQCQGGEDIDVDTTKTYQGGNYVVRLIKLEMKKYNSQIENII